MVTLNIGLNISTEQEVARGLAPSVAGFNGVLQLGSVSRLVQGFFARHYHGSRLALSDTETTLVVRLQGITLEDAVAALPALAAALGQDCIAAADADAGALVGARAEAWGSFDRDYFIEF